MDYPLEPECNPYMPRVVHSAACEAAVAMRLAREHGTAPVLEKWLWANQATLNRNAVFEAARTIAKIPDLNERYDRVIDQVHLDVEIAHGLAVTGTPTYFVNGVALTFIPKKFFEIAIMHELRRAGGALVGAKAPQLVEKP
jgi:protein-disulfide isomerase